MKLVECFSYQLFHTGFVHADPHPGNSMCRLNLKHLSFGLRRIIGAFYNLTLPYLRGGQVVTPAQR